MRLRCGVLWAVLVWCACGGSGSGQPRDADEQLPDAGEQLPDAGEQLPDASAVEVHVGKTLSLPFLPVTRLPLLLFVNTFSDLPLKLVV